MAFTAINKAIAAAVMDAKLSVVNDLVAFLETKIEVDDDLKTIFEEFKTNLKESEEIAVKAAGKKVKGSKKTVSGVEKKKRAPSVFNLYVKDVMPKMKADHPDIKDGKQMIGFASESWKNDPMATFIKEKVLEMKKDDKDGDVVEMYAKAKAMYKESDEAVSDSEPVKIEKKPKAAKKTATKKDNTDDEVVEEEKPKATKKTATKKTKEADVSDSE